MDIFIPCGDGALPFTTKHMPAVKSSMLSIRKHRKQALSNHSLTGDKLRQYIDIVSKYPLKNNNASTSQINSSKLHYIRSRMLKSPLKIPPIVKKVRYISNDTYGLDGISKVGNNLSGSMPISSRNDDIDNKPGKLIDAGFQIGCSYVKDYSDNNSYVIKQSEFLPSVKKLGCSFSYIKACRKRVFF